ncbi:MAG: hypothetical protein ACP5N3_00235 [Candidatus Nanoarchaeia archaeon]
MKDEQEPYTGVMARKQEENAEVDRNIFLIKNKLFLDKVGGGFSSIQFLNILFSFTGASYFIIGFVNALKSVLTTFVSSRVKKCCAEGKFSSDLLLMSGLLFGFSFLAVALAVSLESKWLFALSFLIGSVFFVIHGDMFQFVLDRYLGGAKQAVYTKKLTALGVLVMAAAVFFSAALMDFIPFSGVHLPTAILGSLLFYGYLLSFEIASFAFILSSYFVMKISIDVHSAKFKGENQQKKYSAEMITNTNRYFKNKYLLMLTFATVFLGVFQTMINSFLGIYVYREFFDYWMGGFLNVGFMLALALFAALIGPAISAKMNRNLGVAPLFVFGTLLMALLPLTIVYNSFFPAIVAANVLFILGTSMIGTGHNLVAARLLNEKDREAYYSSSGTVALIPFFILAVLFSFAAQRAGLEGLFKYVGYGIIICLIPIYFSMVVWISKK